MQRYAALDTKNDMTIFFKGLLDGVNIQHPGNSNPSVTNFAAPQDGATVPRDSTIVITRKDGGIVGS